MRIFSFIFLIIWILLFPILGGLIAYFTKNNSFGYLAILSLAAIFNLVWFCLTMNKKQMDLVTKVANLLILNVPAYFAIKKYFSKKEKKEVIKPNSIKEEDFNVDYTPEELKIIEARQNKKLAKKKMIKIQAENEEIEIQRMICSGFGIYLLTLIYLKNPMITSTYQIIQEYKLMVEDELQHEETIVTFCSLPNLDDFIISSNLSLELVNETLRETPKAEFLVILKQDRVEMQIKAKKILTSQQEQSS